MPSSRAKSATVSQDLTLREIMKVFWTVVNVAIEHFGKVKLVGIKESGTINRKKRNGVPVYSVVTTTKSSEKMTPTAPAYLIKQFGQSKAEKLYTAYKKLDMCDWSVMLSYMPIKNKLADLGAEVDWIWVMPDKEIVLHHEEEDVEIADNVLHSVLRVRDPDGEEFIVDFTMEQFGWSRDDFYTPKAVYFQRFVESNKWKSASGISTQEPRDAEELAYARVVRHLCANLNWKKLSSEDEESRLGLLESRVARALKEHIREIKRNPPKPILWRDEEEDDGDSSWYSETESETESDTESDHEPKRVKRHV